MEFHEEILDFVSSETGKELAEMLECTMEDLEYELLCEANESGVFSLVSEEFEKEDILNEKKVYELLNQKVKKDRGRNGFDDYVLSKGYNRKNGSREELKKLLLDWLDSPEATIEAIKMITNDDKQLILEDISDFTVKIIQLMNK